MTPVRAPAVIRLVPQKRGSDEGGGPGSIGGPASWLPGRVAETKVKISPVRPCWLVPPCCSHSDHEPRVTCVQAPYAAASILRQYFKSRCLPCPAGPTRLLSRKPRLQALSGGMAQRMMGLSRVAEGARQQQYRLEARYRAPRPNRRSERAMPEPNQIVRLLLPEELAALSVAAPNVTYHQGPVLTAVEVITIFWGADWGKAPDSALAQQINGFFDWIVTSPLMRLLSEYSTSSMRIGHGSREATFTITASEPGDTQPGGGRIVSDNQIQTALQGWIGNGTVSATTANTLYFVYLPPNVVSTKKTPTGTWQSCVDYCGYHSSVGNVYYAVMPYLTCNGCTFGTTTFDSLTKVSSHEFCEAVTDPTGHGWYDDQVKDGEIGDFCNASTDVVTLDGYTIQREWSRQQNRCVAVPLRTVAFEANTTDLWLVGENNQGDTGFGMMKATSPSICGLPNGGYQIAFQANTGSLWTVGQNNQGDTGFGMMKGTSPSICGLPNGGYQIAFQANTGSLWTVGQNNQGDTGFGMMPGTSPSICAIPSYGGSYEVAFQANTGHLWIIGSENIGDTQLGMMPGTSPSICA